ncbi:MAG: T9SS type A sorting domain-containing protein [Candidatus Latescibacteria bacterium]|nr:T9SS type A sorting domain-containing protein [Candidatus Latescibacterota bacterium]
MKQQKIGKICKTISTYILLISFIYLLPSLVYSDGQWTTFRGGNEILAVEVYGQTVWTSTINNGIYQWDMTDMSSVKISNIDYVEGLGVDADGVLWVGTQDPKILTWDGERWKQHYKPGFDTTGPNTPIWDFGFTPDGWVWIGSRDSDFFKYKPETGMMEKVAITDNDKKADVAYSFANTSDGDFWIGSYRGLCRYDGQAWKIYTVENGFPENRIFSVIAGKDDVLWIDTPSGSGSFDGNSFTTYTEEKELQAMYEIVQKDGYLWNDGWGGTSYGLRRYDGNSWEIFLTEGTMSSRVFSVAVAPNGNVWFGDQQGGCTIFDGTKWTVIDIQHSVNSIAFGLGDTVWLATSGGAYEYDGKSWINHSWDYYDSSVWDITIDKNGNVLAGTVEGLKYYNGVVWTEWEIDTGKLDKQVRAVAFDPDGSFWCGTYGGIVHYDGTTFTRYSTQDGLVNDDVFSLTFDSYGNLWIGTRGGLSIYDGIEFRSLTFEVGLAENEIISAAIGPDELVWIGSTEGLFCYDGETVKPYSIYDNSIHNFITEVVVNNEGVVWVVTQNGVSRFFPDNISSVMDTNQVRPSDIIITGNYPNPFNPQTSICFSVADQMPVSIEVYNISGQKVRSLFTGSLPAGEHTMVWDGRDDTGYPVSSGIYFTRMLSGSNIFDMHRMMLLK